MTNQQTFRARLKNHDRPEKSMDKFSLEDWRQYRRWVYFRRRKRVLEYNKTPYGRFRSRKGQRKYWSKLTTKEKQLICKLRIQRDPIKYKARYNLRNAVRLGKVKRLPCKICGDSKSQGHHKDYSKPLEVIWLCTKHHVEIHRLSKN